ncbi:hypothetical protein ONE63_005762 [Megalurothrips usitatus]|uniref:Uncharacterized protein n=1 Tax=Megalurothrips usitatus TaxID=439358 RepID=A0AAV7Y2T1_9NEOP|nr:hypothetical protein ONE63_005762 [Megalurothrips usitatus]
MEGLTEPPHAVTDFSWDFARHDHGADPADPDLGVDLTGSSATNSSHCAEDDSDDAASLRAVGGATTARPDIVKDLDWEDQEQEEPDAAYSSVIRRGAQLLPVSICRGFEDADDGLGDEDPVYANCLDLDDEPLYENFSLTGLGRLSPYVDDHHLEYSDDEEHIYEHVHHLHHPGHHHPVNVFLALLQGSSHGPISPDPNIYEVPPGAIRRDLDAALFEDGGSGRNITPPSGFQDYEKLSWVQAAAGSVRGGALYDDLNNNRYLRVDTLRDTVVTAAAQDEEDRHKLPVEVIYSTIVKPRRKKKQRPPISAMLQLAATMQAAPTAAQPAAPAAAPADEGPTANAETSEETVAVDVKEAVSDVNDNFIVVDANDDAINDNLVVVETGVKDNVILVDGTEAVTNDVILLKVLPSDAVEEAVVTVADVAGPPKDAVNQERVIVTPPTPPVVSDDEDAVEAEVPVDDDAELIEVIEIGSDGRWDTKELQLDEALLEQQQQGEDGGAVSEACFQECGSEVAKLKHAAMAYGAQYHINSAAAAPPAPKQAKTVVVVTGEPDSDAAAGTPGAPNNNNNIGSRIMKMYEDDRQKVRDSLNLPDVSLLDMDESMEDIERERRRVIENQAVRAKRISSWIKSNGGSEDKAALALDGGVVHLNEDGESRPVAAVASSSRRAPAGARVGRPARRACSAVPGRGLPCRRSAPDTSGGVRREARAG